MLVLHGLMLGWIVVLLLVHVHAHGVVLGLLLLGAVALVRRSVHLTRLGKTWWCSVWLLVLEVVSVLLSILLIHLCLMLVLVLETHALILLLLRHEV